MKFQCRVALVFVSCAFAQIGRAQNPPIAELPAAEFRSLSEKTALYVQAYNNARDVETSYDRYASWVNVKNGPTGKERYISHGLYEIPQSSLDQINHASKKGIALKPALPEMDAAAQKLASATAALAPLLKQARDYYAQEDYKDDGVKRGQELHAQMMPLFAQVFAAEKVLGRELDQVKAAIDRRQLAQIEKEHGKNYGWHLRSLMIAAKALLDTLPESADAPMQSADTYKPACLEVETAYNAFAQFSTEHPDEVKKVLMANLVAGYAREFFGASKFLRRVLDAPKPDQREYVAKMNDLVKAYNNLIRGTNGLR